jgi:hypothetical protein
LIYLTNAAFFCYATQKTQGAALKQKLEKIADAAVMLASAVDAVAHAGK